MVEGDLDSAKAITHTRFAETQDDGSIIIKNVVESLDPSPSISTLPQSSFQKPSLAENFNEQINNMSPPQSPQPKKCRVTLFYFF